MHVRVIVLSRRILRFPLRLAGQADRGHGAEIAFPTSTIHIEGGEPGVSPEPEPEG